MTRESVLEILKEYTKTDSLLKHAFAVEAAMQAYAKKYGEDALKILLENDYKCQKCGSGKRPCIHHIDWDEKNNVYENFAVLCGSCHSALHSWVPERLREVLFLEWMETQ